MSFGKTISPSMIVLAPMIFGLAATAANGDFMVLLSKNADKPADYAFTTPSEGNKAFALGMSDGDFQSQFGPPDNDGSKADELTWNYLTEGLQVTFVKTDNGEKKVSEFRFFLTDRDGFKKASVKTNVALGSTVRRDYIILDGEKYAPIVMGDSDDRVVQISCPGRTISIHFKEGVAQYISITSAPEK